MGLDGKTEIGLLFHRLRASTLLPTLYHRVPPPGAPALSGSAAVPAAGVALEYLCLGEPAALLHVHEAGCTASLVTGGQLRYHALTAIPGDRFMMDECGNGINARDTFSLPHVSSGVPVYAQHLGWFGSAD